MLVVPGILASLAPQAGCAAPPVAVAIAGLAVDRASVPIGATVEATIRFDVSPKLVPLNEDYRVFLHVLDDNQTFLWGDEHDPPIPTSAWRPGQSIQYARRVKVPAYPYLGPAVIAIGLHSPVSGERLALAGDDLGEFAYRVATLTLEPQHESSFVVYDEGWHRAEFDVFGRIAWRWTTARAVLSFRNPHSATRLLLDVQGRPELFDRAQRLSLVVGERTLREVLLNTNETTHLDYELTAAELGNDDVVRLELLVDRTFVPSEQDANARDTRELGVRVFDAYVEPLPEAQP
jgi:hypothetical protein